MKVSVVIPAYNEERRLPGALSAVSEYFSGRFDYELIVVDDGSDDGTAGVCRDFFRGGAPGKLLVNPVNSGKGASVRRGVLESSGDYVLFSDADMSTPAGEAAKLMEALREGYDIAIGSRSLPGSEVRVRQPFLREKMGKCFNMLARLAGVRGVADTQCGFKLFRGECAREVFEKSRISGFSFDVEILLIAGLLDFRVKEVPVVWINSKASRVRVFRDPALMALDLLRIRMLMLSGRYGNRWKKEET